MQDGFLRSCGTNILQFMSESIDYQLNYDNVGQKRKYKLPKKRRYKIIDQSSWLENDLKNQWIYKDYKCYYIVISKFKDAEYSVSCSGAHAGKYKTLQQAQVAAFAFCDKISE